MKSCIFLIKNGGGSIFIFIEITFIPIYPLETGCDLNVHMTLNLTPMCWDIVKEFATNVKHQKNVSLIIKKVFCSADCNIKSGYVSSKRCLYKQVVR